MAVANQLSFSRSAEAQADRVGFQIMTAAGFDPQGMPDFFRRLQRVMGISENSLPAYVRTHPLTSGASPTCRDRASHVSVRKVVSTPDYEFARVRAACCRKPPSDLQNVRNAMQTQLAGAAPARQPALWYGIAFAEQRLGRYAAAETALTEARRLYGNIPARLRARRCWT